MHLCDVDQANQIECFASDLDRLVDRYCDEFDISYAAAVGILHLKAHLLMMDWEASKDDDSDNSHG